jgi:hypothetical protein
VALDRGEAVAESHKVAVLISEGHILRHLGRLLSTKVANITLLAAGVIYFRRSLPRLFPAM